MSLLLLVTRTVQSKFTHFGVTESCNSVTCPLLRSPPGVYFCRSGGKRSRYLRFPVRHKHFAPSLSVFWARAKRDRELFCAHISGYLARFGGLLRIEDACWRFIVGSKSMRSDGDPCATQTLSNPHQQPLVMWQSSSCTLECLTASRHHDRHRPAGPGDPRRGSDGSFYWAPRSWKGFVVFFF